MRAKSRPMVSPILRVKPKGQMLFHHPGSEDVEDHLAGGDGLGTDGESCAPDPLVEGVVLEADLDDIHVLPTEAGAFVVAQRRLLQVGQERIVDGFDVAVVDLLEIHQDSPFRGGL